MILQVFTVSCVLMTLTHAMLPQAESSESIVEVDDISFANFQSVNQMVDFFVRYLSSKLEREGFNEIRLPGMHKSFKTKLMKVEGGFKITDGRAINVTNLYRNGDAQKTMEGADTVITAHIGIRNLGVHFDKYEIYFAKINHSGKIDAVFGRNSILLKIRVIQNSEEMKQNCSAVLEELKVEELDDIKVHINNIGMFENVRNKIHSWVANHVSRWLTGFAHETLTPSLREIIESVNFCNSEGEQ